jgi:hypothetical protein
MPWTRGGAQQKGTALASSISKNKNLINEIKCSAKRLERLYLQQTNPNSKLSNSTLMNIIKDAMEKHVLEDGDVNLAMLKGWFRRGITIYASGRGLNSPMILIEKLVVSIILRRAAMRQPYTITECIELANLLISEYVTQLELEMEERRVRQYFRGESAHMVG